MAKSKWEQVQDKLINGVRKDASHKQKNRRNKTI